MLKKVEKTILFITLIVVTFMCGFGMGYDKSKEVNDKAVRKAIDAQIMRSYITEEYASDDYKPYPAYYLLEVKKELNIMGGYQ